jgi:hypothetical protein
MKSRASAFRPGLQIAISGALAAGFVSLPLVAGRGVGLIDFTPEDIPGSLLELITGTQSSLFEAVCYLACGALAALAYRRVFKIFGGAGWSLGLAVGFFQWLLLGVIVALFSPLLGQTPLVLPTEAPDQSLFGLFCFLAILGCNLIFGTFIGATAGLAKEESKAAQSEPAVEIREIKPSTAPTKKAA